eukprot:scaffold7098_cov124-Isochrysis_galbana.AAC.4
MLPHKWSERRGGGGDAGVSITVREGVDVQPHDEGAGPVAVDNLWPLDHVWPRLPLGQHNGSVAEDHAGALPRQHVARHVAIHLCASTGRRRRAERRAGGEEAVDAGDDLSSAGQPHPFIRPALVDSDGIPPRGQALTRLAVPVRDALVHDHLPTVRFDLGAVGVVQRWVLARDGGQIRRVKDVESRHDHGEHGAEGRTAEPAASVPPRLATSSHHGV